MFGEDDLIKGRDAYSSTLVCSQNGSAIFLLTKSEFNRVFLTKEDVLGEVMAFYQAKQESQLTQCKRLILESKLHAGGRSEKQFDIRNNMLLD